MEQKYQPLFDRIIIRRINVTQDKSEGGIILPESLNDKPVQMGEVLSVGNGKIQVDGTTLPLLVKQGQRVLLGKYSGTEIESDVVVVREDDILAVVL